MSEMKMRIILQRDISFSKLAPEYFQVSKVYSSAIGTIKSYHDLSKKESCVASVPYRHRGAIDVVKWFTVAQKDE